MKGSTEMPKKVEVKPWRRNSKAKVHCPNCKLTMVAEKTLIEQALKRIPKI
jgi:hypothetical protein